MFKKCTLLLAIGVLCACLVGCAAGKPTGTWTVDLSRSTSTVYGDASSAPVFYFYDDGTVVMYGADPYGMDLHLGVKGTWQMSDGGKGSVLISGDAMSFTLSGSTMTFVEATDASKTLVYTRSSTSVPDISELYLL